MTPLPNSPLAGKHIVLGVTGSIAAYKACELTRLSIKAGAEVRVVMTKSACEFVGPLTFQTLSRYPVESDLFDRRGSWRPEHISLADWCDLFVIAPCTANVIAKMAHGLADDLLSSLALACRKPKLIAPAMNVGMLENPATESNIALLRSRGIRVMETESGELACATEGKGRMPEPAVVFAAMEEMML